MIVVGIEYFDFDFDFSLRLFSSSFSIDCTMCRALAVTSGQGPGYAIFLGCIFVTCLSKIVVVLWLMAAIVAAKWIPLLKVYGF